MSSDSADSQIGVLDIADPKRNRLQSSDSAVHDWYRFVLSFPPHLVRHYLNRFHQDNNSLILDPFAGAGTTLVEAKKHKIPSIGMETNPVVYLAARTKTDWSVDPQKLDACISEIATDLFPKIGFVSSKNEHSSIENTGLKRLNAEANKLLLRGSISPLPLHKAITVLQKIDTYEDSLSDYMRVALATTLVKDAGNLRFGPEVGVTKPKYDVDVLGCWVDRARKVVKDLNLVSCLSGVPATVLKEDARTAVARLPENSVSAVITSPPYPNEKDYTRTTRLENVVLGLITNKAELQKVKKQLIRSNTRGVYKNDDDDRLTEQYPEVCALANEIERRRVEMGKTSGFERLYARVTKLYFGGMARHLAELRRCLRPNAHLAYVVGDQASYLRVLIRTAPILGNIATSLGYEVESIDLFRKRAATATRSQLREEVLVLRWPGR
ncbi:DNA methyltransferase [Bifidobacterium sp. A11]|uniref:DNA methyltransferase n=1 Tax=Bifidobacterium sp. A11 TaxID=1394176 RepID=UPI000400DB01|nr:DNA methyltransferase [Bifidobacterium sp. A11]